MGYIEGSERDEAEKFLKKAAEVAEGSTCQRSRCGSVVVKENEIIGQGYNSPPGDLETQRRCSNEKELYNRKVTDKTCCIHAEQRALFNSLKNEGDIEGSVLYFTRIDDEGEIKRSGKPYCTICSKMTLDLGAEEFVLWHEDGIYAYDIEEYNDLSFGFNGE